MSIKFPVEDFVVVGAKRTPFGKFGGGLATLSATDLAEQAAKATLEQSTLKATEVDSVVVGNVAQSSKDAAYISRHVALRLGMLQESTALTINRLCGSGFEALIQGIYRLALEGENAVMCVGSESMSQIPYVMRSARWGARMGHAEVEDFLTSSLTDAHTDMPMAITAENLADRYSLNRSVVDEYAALSQSRAVAAWDTGLFSEEVQPVSVKARKGENIVERDEHMRAGTTVEQLAKLPALFKKNGVVTAGNASGICDGASALLLCKASYAQEKGLKILARIRSWATAGVDPSIMGIGPVPAVKKALDRADLNLKDIELFEVNEAFSAQYLAVEKELGLDRDKTNLCGGAIAIGHPLAASGARLTAHSLYALHRRGGGRALASACIGGGQGAAVLIEVD